MGRPIDAVYEKGAFRPLAGDEVRLAEGQRVRLIVEASLSEDEDPLGLAAKVYEGLSDQEIAEIEKIALDRSHFFTDPTSG
jgi:predicted DNA-binding antitoxin AbrB/MazE fold protein